MELGALRPYRHSGKFGVHALLLAPLAGVLVGWPLGFAYAYLIKWIPFVYLNILLTLGYGAVIGLAMGATLKFCRVRSVLVAAGLALLAGVLANYFQWNGCVHALYGGAPLLCSPAGLMGAMAHLYEHGSWGTRSGGNVTGVMLALIWSGEALTILGTAVYFGTDPIRNTPYCEKSGSWLDAETKFSTLAAFTEAAQVTALQAGDIAPVIEARPRPPGASVFGRLTLKYSPQCKDFFTLKVENVTLKADKEGKVEEQAKALTKDLVLPSELRELVERFADLRPTVAEGTGEVSAGNG